MSNGMDAAQAFEIVHVRPDTITHTVVPVVDAPTGDHFSQAWLDRMATLSPEQRRTLKIAPASLPIVGIDERTAAVRDADGRWRATGAGDVTVFVGGAAVGLDVLP